VAHTLELAVPAFPDSLAGSLGAALPAGAATGNPVDLAGAGEHDLTSYATVTETVLRSDSVDAAVLTGYFGRYVVDIPGLAHHERQVAERIGAAARDTGKPVLVHTMAPDGPTARALWSAGVPAYGQVEAALAALLGLVAFGHTVEPPPPPDVRRRVDTVPSGYWATRRLLAAYGVPFPRAFAVRDRDEVAAAGRGLTAPYVLKAGWPAHKSEIDAVRTGLSTPDELVAAFDAMAARLGPGEYVVEEQDDRPGTVEILVGARRDPDLGPLIVVGAGGTDTEVHRDLAVELAPVSPDTAAAMLDRLRCAALLRGWRGRPPADVAGLAALVADVSRLVAASPRVGELELNPIRVGPDGPIAVDALMLAAAVKDEPDTKEEENPE
jgi:acyl-CoA synthetase (NDP forming)